MFLHRTLLTLVTVACLLGGTQAAAQDRSKVAVVLSGGSARGFAHIGVLKVLEEIDMPIDYVVGTSMGGVIGGLYACGYTPAELESLAVGVDWIGIIVQDINRRQVSVERKLWDPRYLATMGLDGWRIKLPSGLRSGQELMTLYTGLTVPYRNIEDLPIPFAVVAQDLETGDAVRLEKGNLPEAVRASMAIPWLFTPMEIDGRILTDGGTVRNMPVQDAREMGADVVIAVDVGPAALGDEELETMFGVLRQTAIIKLRKETQEQARYADIVIEPMLEQYTLMDLDEAKSIIAIGEESARAMLPELTALADSLNGVYGAPKRTTRQPVETLDVSAMSVSGLAGISERFFKTEMDIDLPGEVTVGEVEKGIARAYGSGFFDRVGYGFEGYPDSTTLRIAAVEKSRHLFRVGLRFDTRTQGSLLLNTTFRNLLLHGATLRLDARLAEDWLFELRHSLHLGVARSFGSLTRVNASRATWDVYSENQPLTTYRSTAAFAEILVGTIFSTSVAIVGGIRPEYIESAPQLKDDVFPKEIDKGAPVIIGAMVDTWDNIIYPGSGVGISARAERSWSSIGNNEDFSRFYLDGRAVIPLRGRTALLAQLYLGTSNGELPFVYQFALGGIHTPWTLGGLPNSFMGLRPQQRLGPHAQAAMLGVQHEFVSQIFGQLRWSVGNTFDSGVIKLESGRYINGLGLTLGVRILTGRAEVTFSTSEVEDFLTHVTLGSAF